MKTILNHTRAQTPVDIAKKASFGAGKSLRREVWFSINTLGLFTYISPVLLEYLDQMENEFFEAVLFEKSEKSELPSPVEFFTEMIKPERESVFVEEVIKNDLQETSGAYWNIVAEGGILKFTLSQTPPTADAVEES